MKKGFENYIKLFMYLVVILLVNIAGITLFFRVDLTKSKMYSLSEASKNVVSTLSEPLTVNVFFTKNLPAPHNNTERYLRDLLAEYAIHANEYFNYRFFNVSPETEVVDRVARVNQELANTYGIYPVQIQLIEKDEVKFKKAYMGLVLIHGDMIERIQTLTSTDGLEYKITTAIQKLNNKISSFLSLTQKIQIKLFLSSSLETVAPYMGLQGLSSLPGEVERIVTQLNGKTYGKLEFHHLDPSKDQRVEIKSEKYNIMNLKWPAISESNIAPGTGVIGLVLEYEHKHIEIPLLNVMRIPLIGTRYDLMDTDLLEEAIGESLETLIDINEHLGVLSGHGAPEVGEGMSGEAQDAETLSAFSSVVSQNYSIKKVNLKEAPIPEGLNCLIIAGPTEAFTDYELYQIDQALMRGINLALFLDAFKEVMPKNQQDFGFTQGPTYVPLKTGLEKLLAHYGVRIKPAFLMDENCFKQRVPSQFGGGERAIYFAPLIKNEFIRNDLAFMRNIKGLVALKVSPLELIDTRISEIGVKATPLIASSEKSWEMQERITLNPMLIRPPEPDTVRQSMPLAFLLEGQFPSYFEGKPLPEKTAEKPEADEADMKDNPEGEADGSASERETGADLSGIEREGGFLARSKPGKIFLMGSSAMLSDAVVDPEGKNPNAMFMMNLIDSLNNRTDFAVMRSKQQVYNPLYDTGAAAKTFVKTFNIVGLPVIVVLFGFVVWLRRQSRKKQIQMMFQK